MPETGHAEAGQVNPDVHHEQSDAYVRGIFWFAGIALAAGIFILAILALVVWRMNAGEERAKPPLRPIIAEERGEETKDFIPTRVPEEHRRKLEAESGRREVQPRLQSDAVEDLKIIRNWEKEELAKGRIPIEKAMQMLADPAAAKRLGVSSRKATGRRQP
jgi:hypothetical protein